MPAPLSLDAYYEQSLPSTVAVSPDGERAAVLVTEYDGADEESVSSLFVVPTDGSEEPYRLTRASDASSPTWSPDGSKLGFLATRDADAGIRAGREPEDDEDDGDEDSAAADEAEDADADADDEDGVGEEEQQVWAFDMERGGDARQLTTREEGVTDFDWGPDGERVVVSARDPTEEQREYLEEREDDGPVEVERLQHKVNGRGWLDDVETYLFVVDAETREERRLDAATAAGSGVELGGGGLSPAWGPNGEIAYRTYDGDDPDDTYVSDLFTIDPDADDPTPERVTDGDLSVGSFDWDADGRRLAFVGSHPRNKHVPSDLYVTDADRTSAESLTDDLDRTVMAVAWADGDVLAAVGDEGQTRLLTVDGDGAREPAFPEQDAYTEVLPYGGLSVDDGGETVGAVLTEPNGREAAAITVGGGATRLTSVADTQAPDSTVTCERVRYESDGVEVEALAYYAGEEPDERPVVVDIHGGPMAYDSPSYSFQTHYWTSRGYVVLQVNYRGSTSYGRAFSEAIRGDWGPRETADVVAGVEHLAERGWIDDDRVFVTGFSQGGVNTAYVLTRSDVATAGAAQHGIYDYRAAFGTDDSHVWWEDDFGLPWEDPETYERTSSITDVDEIDAPLLLTAGGQDWRCPPSQAEQLYVSVKKRGVPAKLVVYPNLPHAYGGPEEATHRLETVTEWFAEHDPAAD
jgi:dipeptidyl aminopeptidase/acylaminoacyl peptidase